MLSLSSGCVDDDDNNNDDACCNIPFKCINSVRTLTLVVVFVVVSFGGSDDDCVD